MLFENFELQKNISQTFMMLFAALKVLSDDNSVAIAPTDNILALIQRDIKAFSDCNEISAREMFLESWRDLATTLNASSYWPCISWKLCDQKYATQYAEVFGKSPSGTLILTLDDPSFTSLGLKDRHNNAAPGSSPVLILFPVRQLVMYLVQPGYKVIYIIDCYKYLEKMTIIKKVSY